MNWRKVCAHDLYCGLLRPRYLWAMLIFMVPCIMNQIDLNFLGYRATWMDYMMGCFEGVNRVDPKTFQFPTMWLLIMGAGLFMNLDYLLGDLSLSGQQIIVRSGNRRGWYFSKCIWNLCSTALYLLLGSLGVLVFTILMGGVPSVANSPTVTEVFFPELYNTGFLIPVGEGLFMTLLLPYLHLAALSMVQMLLCLFCRPVFSFLLCMSQLMVAVYIYSPWVPGNGAMVQRNDMLNYFMGVSAEKSAIVAVAIILLCVVIGCLRFKKTDILAAVE